MKHIKQLKFVLAGIVAFTTVLTLIRPAITFENTICGLEEHTHTENCYQTIENTITHKTLDCTKESLHIHVHSPNCYDENNNIICGYADYMIHEHNEDCYDENNQLICTLPEIKEHTHDGNCYDSENNLICDKQEFIEHTHDNNCYDPEGNLICGLPELKKHIHEDSCFTQTEETVEEQQLVCDKQEHIHTEECYEKEEEIEYVCGKEEHTHDTSCYNENNELICGKEEHVHGSECEEYQLTDEDWQRVNETITLIDELPLTEEIEGKLTELEEDEDQYNEYFEKIYHQVMEAYLLYIDIGEKLQLEVTNAEKLLALDWIYNVQLLSITNEITIQQVNCFGSASGGIDKNLLIYNNSAENKTASSIVDNMFQFPKATSILVSNMNSELSVSEIDINSESNKRVKVIPPKGFLIIIPTGYNGSIETGDIATVDFVYTQSRYNVSGLGKVTFTAKENIGSKPPKDNSNKLSVVQSADTKDLIEVNLYDYNDNINSYYLNNKNLPGFQQNQGAYIYPKLENIGSNTAFTSGNFNFGDSITEDLNAGIPVVTQDNSAGNINKINGGANKPLEGTMNNNLINGYPALSDGTSLSYLFSNNNAVNKVNTDNINGLFQYNETTGAYTFNSRENHAQFNASTNTFTLYDQMISSNFMMYPFGNFLPFNDIVHESAQSSQIDRTYFIQLMNSAREKGNQNLGGTTDYTTPEETVNRYTRMADQLEKFIKMMDLNYGENWTGIKALKKYFEISNIPTPDDATLNNLLNQIYCIDFDEPTDFYFGMEMKMNFMQPKNGLTGKNGQQPMVFYFTGDDDVWVYIDGKLVLDLSGIHRHVGGEIDFTNGTVKYYELSKDTGDVGTIPYKTVSFNDLGLETNSKGTLNDYSTHSFNFYYMERGAGSGVCRMNFNFPLLKKNSISVSKELSVDDESAQNILGNPNFKFQVLKENEEGLFIGPNTLYDIKDSQGNIIGSGKTDENGIFTLKAGQTAIFNDIPENSGRYFVRELLNTDEFSQYGTISVDGSSQTTNYEVTIGSDTFKGVNSPVKDMSDGSTYFHFNNKIETSKLGKLSITKKLESADSNLNKDFKFRITLDGVLLPVNTNYRVGSETRMVTEAGIITLKPNETAVIDKMLAGSTYKIEEIDAEGYEVTYKVNESPCDDLPTGIIKTNKAIVVEVCNKEKSSSVNIPIYKILSNPDGKEHTYQFDLVQVTDQTGNTSVEGGLNASTNIIILESSSQEHSESFTINYLNNQIDSSSKDFFYKITETQLENKEMGTTFDQSVYVVQVTVTKDENGNLNAVISEIYKNNESVGSNGKILFENRITEYKLPETGGPGDWLYIGSGILLITIAGYFLIKRRIHGKEDMISQ